MKRILIVDDAYSWRKYHEDIIKNSGADFEITLANSATTANELLYSNSDEPFDIILTDMQMESDYLPLYAGEWLIEQIQAFSEYKHTEIIIISAAPNIKYIAEKYGVEFIRKADCRMPVAYFFLQK